MARFLEKIGHEGDDEMPHIALLLVPGLSFGN
jgi:hypothetical protein